MGLGIIGSVLFLTILYYIIRAAVEEGTLRALNRYDKSKENKNN
ncbi:hypothetical protein ACQPVP_01600 [Clostridium nigeriense]